MSHPVLVMLLVLVSACQKWSTDPWDHDEAFVLECGHVDLTCESCHSTDGDFHDADAACESCHLDDTPDSHGEDRRVDCAECHEACGWDTIANPHPEGYAQGEAHGQDVNLHDPTEGVCQDCHGADLNGGKASGCDDCHASEGHPDWRTDCTFCHGGELDGTGAPPEDINNETDPDAISFLAHHTHAIGDDHQAYACVECHPSATDALDPGHMFDDTPAVSEVVFTGGISPDAVYDGIGTCGSLYCHGNGYEDGQANDDQITLDCESCHATDSGWDTMSGAHPLHLEEDNIVCSECHDGVVDGANNVVGPELHVDGAKQVVFTVSGMVTDDGGGTCTGSCHGYDHEADGWGHPPGYEAAEIHGLEANLQTLDCQACHGEDLTGTGVALGCDDCHSDEGHVDWRTDCTFCHGGVDGDLNGMPPEDINNEVDEALISFKSHPEHADGSTHLSYDCETCHTKPIDALTPLHAFDGTAEEAEVDFAGGISDGGAYGYSFKTWTCSNIYCHGNGLIDGDVTDSDAAIDCDSCHQTVADQDLMSGAHALHLSEKEVTCADCHGDVVDTSTAFVAPSLHVDGTIDISSGAGWDTKVRTCTVSCHSYDHTDKSWFGGHPKGYEAAEAHGTDALTNFVEGDCTNCHGANLDGGSAGVSCSDCHTKNWEQDCTYCHGGLNDASGVPPEDLDGETDEDLISFKSHPEHRDGTTHPVYDCTECHVTASATYSNASTDVGHWFDSTLGVPEITLDGGLSAGGTYDYVGGCDNVYCHGNGQQDGSVVDGTTSLTCDGCHQTNTDLGELSGTHSLHLGEAGVTCADCHTDVVDAGDNIIDGTLHVNGTADLDPSTSGWNSTTETCTISCHSRDHTDRGWEGGHPKGYDNPVVHGPDSLLYFVEGDCRSCHGTDLGGGTTGVSCDSCHTSGWESDCTYCHGGIDSTGVPPEDLDGTNNEDLITFKSHPEHMDNAIHATYDCDECHGAVSVAFTNAITDAGHWFDATVGTSEVDMGDGLSSAGTYSGGSCSNLYCHGDGQGDNGSVNDGTTALDCSDCHPDDTSGSGALDSMSGEHKKHVAEEGSECYECHVDVVNASMNLVGPELHVDGAKDVALDSSTGMTISGGRCLDQCHGVEHDHDDRVDW